MLLVAAAMVVPPLVGWSVHEDGVHPLSAAWQPRFGPGTLPAIALAAAALWWGPRWAQQLRWHRLLGLSYVAGAAWMLALATVDGWSGVSGVLSKSSEYLPTARATSDVHRMLRGFIARIPLSAAPDNWPTHVAGHPPGALLFFVGLVRIGLGGNLAAGLVVVAVAASTPLAVLLTVRRLGATASARSAAPLIVFAPGAIWSAVSADAVFAAVLAWALYLLAVAATSGGVRALMSLGAGLLLGYGLYLSYGLVLAAPLVLAVLVAAYLRTGRRRPLGGAVLGATVGVVAVAAAFTAAGFRWWDAYPVLTDRYWDGDAHLRPGAYWTWADLALLCLTAGPVLGPALATGAQRLWSRTVDAEARTVLLLGAGATLAVAVADASQMSRGEVERIWLPFVPWLLLLTALLPSRWRRAGLAGQLVVALVIQSLLFPRW